MRDRICPSKVENSAENFGENDSEIYAFSRQKRPFFRIFFARRPSPLSCGLLWRVSLNPGHVGVEDYTKITSNPKIRVWHFELF